VTSRYDPGGVLRPRDGEVGEQARSKEKCLEIDAPHSCALLATVCDKRSSRFGRNCLTGTRGRRRFIKGMACGWHGLSRIEADTLSTNGNLFQIKVDLINANLPLK